MNRMVLELVWDTCVELLYQPLSHKPFVRLDSIIHMFLLLSNLLDVDLELFRGIFHSLMLLSPNSATSLYRHARFSLTNKTYRMFVVPSLFAVMCTVNSTI